jgi:hypothetical protein
MARAYAHARRVASALVASGWVASRERKVPAAMNRFTIIALGVMQATSLPERAMREIKLFIAFGCIGYVGVAIFALLIFVR